MYFFLLGFLFCVGKLSGIRAIVELKCIEYDGETQALDTSLKIYSCYCAIVTNVTTEIACSKSDRRKYAIKVYENMTSILIFIFLRY